MSVSVNNSISAGELFADEPGEVRVPPKVLLLDEQAHVVRVIRLNLERCGFQVESAEDINSAMQLMRDCRFDALISTEERPAADIMELCRRGSELLARHDSSAGGKGADGKASEGKTADGILSDGKTADGVMSDGKTAEGMMSDGKAVPLMLISCREEDDLSDTIAGFERLGHPVSLKRIVERLQKTLGDASANLSD